VRYNNIMFEGMKRKRAEREAQEAVDLERREKINKWYSRRDHHDFRTNSLFKSWSEEAHKELSSFIEENPEKMSGFKFISYHNDSCDPHYGECIVRRTQSGRFVIVERNAVNNRVEEVDYDGYTDREGYTPETLSWRILNKNKSGMYGYGSDHLQNSTRNYILRKIEEQTGFDLKRKLMDKGF
jgi:hypothetical protein